MTKLIEISLKEKGEPVGTPGSVKIGTEWYNLIWKQMLGIGAYGEVHKYALMSREKEIFYLAI